MASAPLPRPVTDPLPLGEVALLVDGQPVLAGDSTATGAWARASVTGVELDSRAVVAGDLFAALPGRGTHGARFVGQALDGGAVAVLTDTAGLRMVVETGRRVPVIVVDDPRAVLGRLSAVVYGNRELGLPLLGVTGTNGKTTVTAMVDGGLRAAGLVTGIIGTTGVRIGADAVPGQRTTPEAPHTHALLALMRERGVQAAAMEVSSIAIEEGRVDGLRFDVAGFTNLSVDHLDYHGSLDAYFAAKAALFTPERAGMAVVCIDDEWGRRLARQLNAGALALWTVSAGGAADAAGDVEPTWRIDDTGTITGPDGIRTRVTLSMAGAFNRANAVLAVAMLNAVGVDPDTAAAGVSATTVPGRMEVVVGEPGRDDGRRGIRGVVDYAHSPDAIERVLDALRPEVAAGGRLVVVVGAGGDRDRGKRPQMGAVAARLADAVIVTDDNPRSEEPAAIRAAVLDGARPEGGRPGGGAVVEEIGDRAAAIRRAVALAEPGDVVAVLGKGHETGQEIAGVMVPFDDRAALAAALRDTPEAGR